MGRSTSTGASTTRPALATQLGEFYTVGTVAQIFGWSKNTVHNGIRNGAIPCVRLGRVIRIPERWVNEFIASQLDATATDLTEADHDARTALAFAVTSQRPAQVQVPA